MPVDESCPGVRLTTVCKIGDLLALTSKGLAYRDVIAAGLFFKQVEGARTCAVTFLKVSTTLSCCCSVKPTQSGKRIRRADCSTVTRSGPCVRP